MKIAILGAGALGCAIGGLLAEGGNEVWLLNRNKQQIDAIKEQGLVLRDSGSDRSVQVRASTDPTDAGVVDLVVVLVKSYHTAQAMQSAMSLLGQDTVVLSLQNGVGHEDILAEIVGRERVLAGKTYVGGAQLDFGHFLTGTRGKETLIGELDGGVSVRVKRIAQTFTAAGLETTVVENILGTIWDKLLVNVATGALSAITRLTYGQLYALPELHACAIAAVAEAMSVARASGIQLSTDDPNAPWIKAAAGLPPDFKASMLQSLEKGMPTEIDYVNGAVVSQGIKVGIPTPINQTLVACIKGIERGLV